MGSGFGGVFDKLARQASQYNPSIKTFKDLSREAKAQGMNAGDYLKMLKRSGNQRVGVDVFDPTRGSSISSAVSPSAPRSRALPQDFDYYATYGSQPQLLWFSQDGYAKGGGVTLRLHQRMARPYAKGGLAAAERVRKLGREDDDILLHISSDELDYLKGLWGEPTYNPRTNLPEYGLLKKAWKKVKKVAKKAVKGIKSVVKSPIFQTLAPIALNLFVPGLGAAVGGMLGASGAAASVVGNAVVGAALGGATGGTKGALSGAILGGMGGGGGKMLGAKVGLQGNMAKIAGDALLSGVASSARGDKFGKGALMGGALAAATPYVNNALAKTEWGQNQGLTDQPTIGDDWKNAMNPETAPLQKYDELLQPEEVGPPTSLSNSSNDYGPPIPGRSGVNPVTGAQTTAAEAAAMRAGPPVPNAQAPNPNGSFGPLGNLAKKYGMPAMLLLSQYNNKQKAPKEEEFKNDPRYLSHLPQLEFNRELDDDLSSYYQYGESGGEHQFYGDTNQLPTFNPEEQDQPGMAHGGRLSHRGAHQVIGPGSGRDDLVEARLSPGEYVFDAETVSLLGDGNTDEGARRLDEMRRKLRMHKGRQLAQGKFSANAKRPDQYLE